VFFDLALQDLLVRIVAALAAMSVLGVVAAGAARVVGDLGPARDGRLTLNPAAHVGLFGFLAAWLFQIGWARPLDVRPGALGDRPWRIVAVPLAGSASLVALALALSALRPALLGWLSGEAAFAALAVADAAIGTALASALGNLVPVPPMMGGLVLRWARPVLARRLEAMPFVTTGAWIAVFFAGAATGILPRIVSALRAMLGVP
jgi:Zn-dependent protease